VRIQTAADLDEAQETLQEDGSSCALILLAAQPSVEGTCATIRDLLRHAPEPSPTVAVLDDKGEDWMRTACLDVGAIEVLAKPVDVGRLVELLDGRLCGGATTGSPLAAADHERTHG